MFREFPLGAKIERETLGFNDTSRYEKEMATEKISKLLENFLPQFTEQIQAEFFREYPQMFETKSKEEVEKFIKGNFIKAVVSPESLATALEKFEKTGKKENVNYRIFRTIRNQIKNTLTPEFMEAIIISINDPEKIKRPFNVSIVESLMKKLNQGDSKGFVRYYSAILDDINKKTQIDYFAGTDAFLHIYVGPNRYKIYIDVTGNTGKVSEKERIVVETSKSKLRVFFSEEDLDPKIQQEIGKGVAEVILEMIDKK